MEPPPANSGITPVEDAISIEPIALTHILRSTLPSSSIRIGYTRHCRHYLDRLPKAPNTERQILDLHEYYEQHFTATDRFMLRWLLCQRPIIQISELELVVHTPTLPRAPDVLTVCLKDTHDNNFFPREVHFRTLTPHPFLTAGFLRPELLRESGQMFHESSDFDVQVRPLATASKQKVLCIGLTIDKKMLVWPLLLTICMAGGVAVAAGYITCSVATGAEVGSLGGVVFNLVWVYVLWVAAV